MHSCYCIITPWRWPIFGVETSYPETNDRNLCVMCNWEHRCVLKQSLLRQLHVSAKKPTIIRLAIRLFKNNEEKSCIEYLHVSCLWDPTRISHTMSSLNRSIFKNIHINTCCCASQILLHKWLNTWCHPTRHQSSQISTSTLAVMP
jgi:hypothetical protein